MEVTAAVWDDHVCPIAVRIFRIGIIVNTGKRTIDSVAHIIDRIVEGCGTRCT